MKKILIFICLGFATISNSQNYQLTDFDCKDLWMSEILRHDTIIGSQSYGNYSIELFNPLTTTVSLTNYSLRFLTANNSVVNVTLKGTVPSKGTWVITNSNAETSLKALSDCDTTVLNFNQYVEVKLVKTVGTSTTVIDVFGQPATPQQITFNYLLFMQDPNGYAATYGIPLDNLQNIDIRRSAFVNHGISTFNAVLVVHTWAFYYGADHSGIGNHKCACNFDPKRDLPIVGYTNPGANLDEDYSLSNDTDPLDLTWIGLNNSIVVSQGMINGTAVFGTHIGYSSNTNPITCYYNPNVPPNCTYAQTLNHPFIGIKYISSEIFSAPNFDYSIDNATKDFFITIYGNTAAGIKVNTLEGVKIFPSVTSDYINIDSPTEHGKFNITNLAGQQIKSGNFSKEEHKIDVSGLPNAMYFITFTNQSGISRVDKFIKD